LPVHAGCPLLTTEMQPHCIPWIASLGCLVGTATTSGVSGNACFTYISGRCPFLWTTPVQHDLRVLACWDTTFSHSGSSGTLPVAFMTPHCIAFTTYLLPPHGTTAIYPVAGRSCCSRFGSYRSNTFLVGYCPWEGLYPLHFHCTMVWELGPFPCCCLLCRYHAILGGLPFCTSFFPPPFSPSLPGPGTWDSWCFSAFFRLECYRKDRGRRAFMQATCLPFNRGSWVGDLLPPGNYHLGPGGRRTYGHYHPCQRTPLQIQLYHLSYRRWRCWITRTSMMQWRTPPAGCSWAVRATGVIFTFIC